MFALPPDLSPGTGDQVSGITFPSCHGSLRVRALLADVIDYQGRVADPGPDGTYGQRRRQAHECAAGLRAVLDGDQPITFAGDTPADTGGHDG